MEPHETGLSSYRHPPSTTAPLHPNAVNSDAATASPSSNGGTAVLPNHGTTDGANTTIALYPQSVAGKAPTPPPLDSIRKKRGRPRKYATPEEAAAAKRAASTSLSPLLRKREQQGIDSPSSSSTSSKRSQLGFVADSGQCFMPYVINVNPGEDVAQKILLFVQQSQRELCILSASGCVSNASLLQSSTAGGSISYEGRFDILSLTGSLVHTDIVGERSGIVGERSGGINACLVGQNGNVIGGGITGPFIAAGHVEVILATFQMEPRNDDSISNKGEATTAAASLASPTNTSVSPAGYRPVFEPSPLYAVPMMDGHQNVEANSFMVLHPELQMGSLQSTDWRVSSDSGNGFNFDFTGRTGHESLVNGDYKHRRDRDC